MLNNFSSSNSANGATPYSGLVQGSDKFLYGVTSSGGANKLGVLTDLQRVERDHAIGSDEANPDRASRWIAVQRYPGQDQSAVAASDCEGAEGAAHRGPGAPSASGPLRRSCAECSTFKVMPATAKINRTMSPW